MSAGRPPSPSAKLYRSVALVVPMAAPTWNVPTTTPGTTTEVNVPCGIGSDNGEFPNLFDSHNVWNNANSDGSFGVTSPIFLDDITTDGWYLGNLPIPTNQIVTSFSSKSELALNRSTDGKSITFMGYRGGVGCGGSTGFAHRAKSLGCFRVQYSRRLRSHQSRHHHVRDQWRHRSRGVLPRRRRSGCRRPHRHHRRQRLQRRQRPRGDQRRQRPVLHGRQRQQRQPVEEANPDHAQTESISSTPPAPSCSSPAEHRPSRPTST